jgi:outer membrane protein assembly factor BamE
MRKALPLLLVALLATGCGIIYRQPVYQGSLLEKQDVEQLREGMTPSQVIGLLGTPPLADPFHNERWDYIASERHRRGRTEVKNLTVFFEGGKVAKWEGEYFPEQDMELVQEMRKFGNLPREKDKNRSR